MENVERTPAVDDTYTYVSPKGDTYTGHVAYVLNHLDSAESSMSDNIPDLFDGSFTAEQLIEELRLYDALNYILDHAHDLAPYL
jgi:hypothetical protein